MEVFESLILGIIQGLTEFLPVSSSGHLEIGKAVLGNDFEAKESLIFTIILHAATALSTVFVFRKDIFAILEGLFDVKNNDAQLFSLKIVISMVPAALVGLFFEDQIAELFGGNLVLVGAMLLVTAALLFMADRAKETKNDVTNSNATLIGIVQAIAILPGISRSGATIATAVLLGLDREKAARFSFLMVLPLIFGSMAKSILDFEGGEQNFELLPLIVGFIAAFITGIVACQWMIALVKKSKLKYFSFYCIIVGSIALIYGLF